MASGLPTIEISASELDDGLGLLTALVTAGLANSNGEARRHIKGGAVKVNDVKAENEKVQLSSDDINDDGVIKLSFGKKTPCVVESNLMRSRRAHSQRK